MTTSNNKTFVLKCISAQRAVAQNADDTKLLANDQSTDNFNTND